ncbi:MAG TPA: translocation/assembly module TamB domain-containing protein [Candidatus Ozemobacteraceae bacterium]|nr:translocation/assembly module TamB domain-containing protein [Candidatus Ozemobacteraceae bacterium]
MSRRRLILALVLLTVAVFSVAGLFHHAWNRTIELPTPAAELLKQRIAEETGAEISYETLKISGVAGTGELRGAVLKTASDTTFATIETANAQLASGTGLLDILTGDAAFDVLSLDGVSVDLRRLPFPTQQASEAHAAAIPVRHLDVTGMNVITQVGTFVVDAAKIDLRRVHGDMSGSVRIKETPFGGGASVTFSIPFDLGTSTISIAWGAVDIPRAAALYPLAWLWGVGIDTGSATIALRWSGHLRNRLESLDGRLDDLFSREMTGLIDVSGLGIRWKDHIALVDARAESKKNRDAAWDVSVATNIDASRLAANFAFDRAEAGWGIGASGTVSLGSGARELLKDLHDIPDNIISGTATATFLVHRHPGKNWQGSVETEISRWMIDRIPVDTARLVATTEGARVRFTADAFSRGGHVAADGVWTPAGHLVESDIRLKHLSSTILPELGAHVTGWISGEGHLVVPLEHPASTSFDGAFSIDRPMFGNRHAERASAMISVFGTDWCVEKPEIIIASESAIRLDGSLSPAALTGELCGTHVPARFLGFDPKEITGSCQFRVDLSGSIADPRFTGELWAEGIHLWSRAVRLLRAKITGSKRFLTLEHLGAEIAGGGEIRGSLGFDIPAKRFVATRFDVANADVTMFADLLPVTRPDLVPSGTFHASFERLDQPREDGWRFSLIAPRLLVASAPFHGLTIEGVWSNHQLQKLAVSAGTGNGTITLHGHQMSDAWYAGDVSIRDIDMAVIGTLLRLDSPIRGSLTADGTLVWNEIMPTGRLTLLARDLAIGDRILGNGGGELVIDPSGMTMNRVSFDRMGIQLSGRMLLDRAHSYTCKVQMNRTDLSAFPAAFGFRSFQRNDLLVTGNCRIEGRAVSGAPDRIDSDIHSMEIRRGADLIVANRPMKVLYQHGIVELRSFELKYRQGVFGAEGTWDPAGMTALTLTGRDFSLRALGNLLEIPDWTADGSLSFDGGIVGSFPGLRLDADIDVKDLAFRNRKIPEITGRIEVTPGMLMLEDVDINLRHTGIGITGRVPIPGGTGSEPIDVAIEIASGPIEDLPLLLPEAFAEASGTMHASLRLFGRPRAPAVSGELNLAADVLGLRGMKVPLKHVQIGLTTKDGVVRLEPLRATMGRGVLEGTGLVDFQDGNGAVNAHLSGQKLDLNWNAVEVSGASASIDLGGSLYRPVVRGRVRIPKGRALIGDMKAISTTKLPLPLEELDYRFDIEIPRNFWVKNSFMNAEMRGDFSAFGTLDRFRLAGSIQSVQGWLFFQRRKFLLETGEIRFGGEDEVINPHLYIKSVTNVQNTQIYLTLDGTVSSFSPRLHSSPPLAESDLIALLTLGRSMEQARQTDAKDLFEKEVLEGLKNTYLSGLIGSTISTALNLDEVFFGSLFDRTTGITRSFLRVGKYIGRNIFLAYEGTLSNEGEKTYIFEYRLPRGFFINIEVEKPRNRTRFGVKYDWKF